MGKRIYDYAKTALSDEQRELVVAHLEYAKRGAAKYWRRDPRQCRDDFESAAYFGLVNAALRFDPSKGWKFTTFSYHWIDKYLRGVWQLERRQRGWSWSQLKGESQQLIQRVRFCALPQRSNGEPIEIRDEPRRRI